MNLFNIHNWEVWGLYAGIYSKWLSSIYPTTDHWDVTWLSLLGHVTCQILMTCLATFSWSLLWSFEYTPSDSLDPECNQYQNQVASHQTLISKLSGISHRSKDHFPQINSIRVWTLLKPNMVLMWNTLF